ncbi:MAG: hypothetical protein KAU03_05295, partial [Candidatus Altiarchaeales archaeon]|nr:hypothetical protein [Candidatus Altiarchaeales archaeon]
EAPINFHTADRKLVDQISREPILKGARLNIINSDVVVSKGLKESPLKPGYINIMSTHILNELSHRGYTKGIHLFSDEPPAALEAPELVISETGKLTSHREAINFMNSDKALIYAVINEISRVHGKRLSLRDFQREGTADVLVKEGILEKVSQHEYRLNLNNLDIEKIKNNYRYQTRLGGDGKRIKYDNVRLEQNIQLTADVLAKQEKTDFVIDRKTNGKFLDYHLMGDEPMRNTHFGGGDTGNSRNLPSRILAIKYGADKDVYEKHLSQFTKPASNYKNVIKDVDGYFGFSATATDFRPTFEALGIKNVEVIGKDYRSDVFKQYNVISPDVDVSTKGKKYTQQVFGESGETKSGKSGFVKYPQKNKITVLAEQIAIRDDISISEAKEIVSIADRFSGGNRVAQQTLIRFLFKREGADYLISDYRGQEIENAAAQLEKAKGQTRLEFYSGTSFKNERAIQGIDKAKIYPITYRYNNGETVKDGLKNYDNLVKESTESRSKNLATPHIIIAQNLIEGSNIAKKIKGSSKEVDMVLFGFYSQQRAIQAAQRIGLTPPTKERRTPGEFYHYIEKSEIPVQYHSKFEGVECSFRDSLMDASKAYLVDLNGQKMYSESSSGISVTQAKSLKSFRARLDMNYQAVKPSEVKVSSVLNRAVEADRPRLEDRLDNWKVPHQGVLTNQGAAIVELATQLMNSFSMNNGWGNFDFLMNKFSFLNNVNANNKLSFVKAFLVAEFLAENVVFLSQASEVKSVFLKLNQVGSLIDNFNLSQAEIRPQEIREIFSPDSDFALYNLISLKLKEFNPAAYQQIKQQLDPAIKTAQTSIQLQEEMEWDKLLLDSPDQQENWMYKKQQSANFALNSLKYAPRLKWNDYKLNKIATLGDLDKIAETLNIQQPEKTDLTVDLGLMLISNLNDITGGELGALKRMNQILSTPEIKDTVDVASIPFIKVVDVGKGKISPAELFSKYSKNRIFNTYAQRIDDYVHTVSGLEALGEKDIYYDGRINNDLTNQVAAQFFNEETKPAVKFLNDIKKRINSLARVDINLVEDRRGLSLTQLRDLSDNTLPDELLLTVYGGYQISNKDIKKIKFADEMGKVIIRNRAQDVIWFTGLNLENSQIGGVMLKSTLDTAMEGEGDIIEIEQTKIKRDTVKPYSLSNIPVDFLMQKEIPASITDNLVPTLLSKLTREEQYVFVSPKSYSNYRQRSVNEKIRSFIGEETFTQFQPQIERILGETRKKSFLQDYDRLSENLQKTIVNLELQINNPKLTKGDRTALTAKRDFYKEAESQFSSIKSSDYKGINQVQLTLAAFHVLQQNLP